MNNEQNLRKELEKLQRAVKELSLLNDLARSIGASNKLEKIMQKIISHSLRAVQAEQCTITLVPQKSDDPMKTLVRTIVSRVQQDPFHLNQVLLGWMLQNKKPLSIANPQQDERFSGVQWDQEIHSLLCVPLLVKSKLIGILTAFNKIQAEKFTHEDLRLLGIIAAQSAQIIENARLYEEEKALLRMKEELNLARQIQTDLLPSQIPDVPGYDLAGISVPAESVGGDYFDFIPIDDHSLAVCLADVSGKGLPAALLMSNLQAIIRSQTFMPGTVAECLERSNKILYRNTAPNKFATVFFGILDVRTNRFCYANAGHDRPLVVSTGASVQELPTAGLPLGFLEEASYGENCFEFKPNDLLLIYTDGISEAMNKHEEEFSVDRIIQFLNQHHKNSAQAVIDGLIAQVNNHAAGFQQSDDMTLIVVKKL